MISIIVPTYNESKNIPRLVKELYDNLSKTKERFEIVIVDDNSPDRTWEIAGRYSKYHVRVIRRTKDRGLSSSVIEGFKRSKGDILGVIDADLSHPPKLLPKMFEEIKGNDVVVASRYIKSGRSDFTLYRKIVSIGATALSYPLTKVRDPMSGYFMIRRSALKNAPLRPKGYKILLEVLVKGRYDRNKVCEVPYRFGKRLHGQSKLGFRVYMDYIRQLLSLYWYVLFKK